MAPYIFVIAALILAVCTIIVFSSTLSQLKQNPEAYEQLMQKFMIKVFLVEIIPIALVVYGFSLKHQVTVFSELYVPLTIIVAIMAITAITILLRIRVDVDPAQQQQITILGLIAIALANSIPIIGIVALFTMTASL